MPEQANRFRRLGQTPEPRARIGRVSGSFRKLALRVGEITIGGAGPPVLLLPGHRIWHAVAPALAVRHTVVMTEGGEGGSERALAHDQLLLMRELGFERFAVAGHDCGGHVAHRLALDHPAAVFALAVLDIVPGPHASGGRRLTAPLLALWGERSQVGRSYRVLDVWRGYAEQVDGRPLPAGHDLPEEAPQDTAEALLAFFAAA
jgi:pimeloyl-ACP methyl ester carboxylesterase